MTRSDSPFRTAILALGLFLLAAPASAQQGAPAPPAPPPPMAQIEDLAKPVATPAAAPRRNFYLKPETELAARDSEAKMEAIQRKIDARVRQATRSICDGCRSAPAPKRPRLAAPKVDEPVFADPAEAPVD